jgi:6-phosphogluconate dehydrogenase
MQLGLIGLGKMGGNMAERLRKAGHKIVGFDFSAEAVKRLSDTGSVGVNSLEDMVKNLTDSPRAIWIMVPAGDPVDQTIEEGRLRVCGCGHVGRRLGHHRGLFDDDRRR